MFETIGGERAIDKLVDDFYEIMSTDPQARECFATHKGKDIKESAHKLKSFLSGWLGGPQLYLEEYGRPRLRMRHFPFAIGSNEAEQWLYCMRKALQKSSIDKKIQEQMMSAFERVAKMVRNKED